MYVCIMNKEGKIHLHRNMRNDFEIFKRSIQPFIQSLSVGCETSGYYYWLADGCREAGIPFHLGHALYMTAISGKKKKERRELIDRFDDPDLQMTIASDLDVMDSLDPIIHHVELKIIRGAKYHDHKNFHLLLAVPGIGEIIALTILYEIYDINRFPTVQKFSSYAGLVKCERESAGKNTGGAKGKIRNAFLKHAFSEIILTAQVGSPKIKKYYEKMKSKHGQKKARAMIAHKFGVAIYFMLKNGEAFDEDRFINRK